MMGVQQCFLVHDLNERLSQSGYAGVLRLAPMKTRAQTHFQEVAPEGCLSTMRKVSAVGSLRSHRWCISHRYT